MQGTILEHSDLALSCRPGESPGPRVLGAVLDGSYTKIKTAYCNEKFNSPTRPSCCTPVFPDPLARSWGRYLELNTVHQMIKYRFKN